MTSQIARRDISDQSDQRLPAPLDDLALHGLAGDYVRAVEPFSEADRSALLAHFLVGAGVALGPHCYARAGDALHPARLFAVVVGESSKGRKGSSLRPAQRVLALAGFDGRIEEGLTSGEGLIWAVRDPIQRYERPGRGSNAAAQLVTADPGVDDKRLFIVESEFASVLRVMEREGNTLSAVMRRAWDSGDLSQLVKNAAAVATGAHIGIVGHSTREEVVRYLTRTELGSGFANRFLWFRAMRARLLPDGESVPQAVLTQYAVALRRSIEWASAPRFLQRDQASSKLWRDVYEDLSTGRTGILGAVTNRGEAQVLRLSSLYALLDRSDVITRPHLEAALAVWQYAFESATWVFGDAIGDPVADAILFGLKNNPDGLDRSALRDLFGRHLSQDRVETTLGRLLASGRVQRVVHPTGGRPREVWSLLSHSAPVSGAVTRLGA